jgi:hypothetical protein
MNSYSENLHSSVLATLGSQEMNNKQLSAQLDASMFALYYSEAAEIVSIEKLVLIKQLYKKKQAINDLAVKNKNMSNNLLLSANEQKTYVAQSVTNMAVAASNIQIATNAVVRLASDVGSIFSIINAADYGTQIFQQCVEAYNLINKTAYNAEVTSQQAMESSASIAEVAASTIADKAKITSDSVNNLLQITTADLAIAAAKINSDTEDKYNASIATRSAEGVIKCSKVRSEAAKKAYKINNKKLNQNLRVEIPKPFTKSYSVSFDFFKPPFIPGDKSANTPNTGLDKPVKSYNILLVKESKKSFFSVSNAEELLNNPSQYIGVPVTKRKATEEEIIKKYKQYYDALKIADNDNVLLATAKANEKKAAENVTTASTAKEQAKTALEKITAEFEIDQDEVKAAKNEVHKIEEQLKKDPKNPVLKEALKIAIAVLKAVELNATVAKLKEEKAQITYKTASDDFEIAKAEVNKAKKETENADAKYIVAAEKAVGLEKDAIILKQEGFTLVNTNDLLDSDNDAFLFGEKYVVFLLTVFTEDYKKEINTFDDYLSAPSEVFAITNTLTPAEDIAVTKSIASSMKIDFSIPESAANLRNIEYRCLFLPYPDGLLTNEELNTVESKIELLEENEELIAFNNEIDHLNEEIREIEREIKSLNKNLQELPKKEGTPQDPKNEAEIKHISKKLENFEIALKEAEEKLKITKLELDKIELEIAKTNANYPKPVQNNKAFFFNLKLAQNIPAGNYTVAGPPHEAGDSTDFSAKIDFSTTDNFGNPLIEGTSYIPVVLSFYNGLTVNKSKYTNILSDWENTDTFLYSTTKKTLLN